jgi:hypothetical protein
MPSIVSHYHFGQEVLRGLPLPIKTLISRHKAVFNLGLQGPDLLFYYKPYRRNNAVSGLGISIHYEKARPIVTGAVERIKADWNDAALCYLMGFVCHYVLDSSLHEKIKDIAPNIGGHFRLEGEMDRQILQTHYAPKPSTYRRENLVKVDRDNIDYLKAVYPTLTARQLRVCVRSIAFYQRILHSRWGIKAGLLRPVELIVHQDGLFTGMVVRRRESKKFGASARELCKRAATLTPDGIAAVENVFACATGNAALTGRFDQNFE